MLYPDHRLTVLLRDRLEDVPDYGRDRDHGHQMEAESTRPKVRTLALEEPDIRGLDLRYHRTVPGIIGIALRPLLVLDSGQDRAHTVDPKVLLDVDYVENSRGREAVNTETHAGTRTDDRREILLRARPLVRTLQPTRLQDHLLRMALASSTYKILEDA